MGLSLYILGFFNSLIYFAWWNVEKIVVLVTDHDFFVASFRWENIFFLFFFLNLVIRMFNLKNSMKYEISGLFSLH